jgi:hypothetical protein
MVTNFAGRFYKSPVTSQAFSKMFNNSSGCFPVFSTSGPASVHLVFADPEDWVVAPTPPRENRAAAPEVASHGGSRGDKTAFAPLCPERGPEAGRGRNIILLKNSVDVYLAKFRLL